MLAPSRHTQEFLQLIERAKHSEETRADGNKIHVSELASLPSFVYEKLRNIVDYKDEYLLRKNAIKRFLRRSFVVPKLVSSPQASALALVRELTLSRYLPNDSVGEVTIGILTQVLTKYQKLIEEVSRIGCDVPKWRETIYGVAAVECDAHLISPAERNAYVTYGYRLLQPILELPDALESDEAKNVQLVMSLERVLERADRDILTYYLFRHYYVDWFTQPPEQAAKLLAPNLAAYLNTFQRLIEYPLGKRLLPHVRRQLIPLVVLRDLLRNYSGNEYAALAAATKLEDETRRTYRSLWQATRRRLRRKGLHAMAYIFLTKMVLAIAFEYPYELYVIQEINYLPLAINLIFPPLLMLIITLLIKSPGEANEQRIVQAVHEMIYSGEPDFFKPRRIRTAPPSFWKRFSYGLLYTITMGGSFGLLVFVLSELGFNLLSGALFIFFVSLVSFFGISLRQQARQLKVVDGRETLSAFLVDFFTLPVVAFGKWLSTTFDRINVFVFVLDFLFEIPFKSLLKMIEDWFMFLKQKKEDMY